jgi:hypothetical protein
LNNKFKWALPLGASFAVLIYTYWHHRSGQAGLRQSLESARGVAKLNQAKASVVHTVRFEQAILESGSADEFIVDVQRVILDAPMYQQSDLSEPLVKSLIRAVSEFVFYSMVNDDPDKYIMWRRSNGFQFRDKELMFKTWGVAKEYELLFNEPISEHAEVQDVFKLFWDHRLTQSNLSLPTGMSFDPSELFVGCVKINPIEGFRRVELGARLNQFWYEPVLASSRCWFQLDSTVNEQNSDEAFYCGTVGLVVEYEDGSKLPVLVSALLGAQDTRWSIQLLWTNDPAQKGAMFEY